MDTKERAPIGEPEVWFREKFLAPLQYRVIRELMRGEEGEFFRERMRYWAEVARDMPVSYETDEQGDNAVVHLHYFKNGWDWYITERDMEPEQSQMFGLVKGFEVELGYIPLQEVLRTGAELDLHWTPRTVGEVRKELEQDK